MAIDFYYTIASPPCMSVMMLAENIGVQLNLKEMNLLQKDQLTSDFVKINPQHSLPTIVDDGYILWDSHAILGYLANQYSKDDSLYPKDPRKRAIVDQRLYFNAGTLFPRMKEYTLALTFTNDPDADKNEKMEEALQFLNTFLDDQDFVAGDHVTIADYAIVSTFVINEIINYDLNKCPNIRKWYNNVSGAIGGLYEFEEVTADNLKILLAGYKEKREAQLQDNLPH